MDGLAEDLLKKIENLLNSEVGDNTRLDHIRRSILQNKKLYNSDIRYVKELWVELSEKNESEGISFAKPNNSCWSCKKNLEELARFCSYCGANQDQKNPEFAEVLSRRQKREYNPFKIISNLHSYQILAVIGGLCALIPIIVASVRLDRIFEVLEFYSNQDFSELRLGFVALGVITGVWSSLVMIIPFLIKKPKKVGKFLFFSAFGILVCSLTIGVIGFVIILFAGIFALKKRRY